MRPFDQRALQEGVTKREVLSWAAYDFANSGYTTVVLTAVFSAYFVGQVAGNASWATFLWTFILGLSNLAVMLTMPAIGRRSDARASRKSWLLGVTLVCVACVCGLYWVRQGDILLAVALIILSNYCWSLGESLCAAWLPELARPEAMGRVSGWGWGFGYLGGMLTLGVSLFWVSHVQGQGGDAADAVPGTMLITATLYLLAALPMFLFVRDRALPHATEAAQALRSLLDIRQGWRRLGAFADFRRFLLVGFCFNAGVFVVITLTAVYAEQVMGFQMAETMTLFFAVNIAAALGAFLFGHVEDRIGHRHALMITLLGWIAVVALAVFMQSRAAFWGAATLAGLCIGSSQSVGRALAGVMAPGHRLAEFYGLWAAATRSAAIIGPITYGAISWGTGGNHRMALLCTGAFFVVALALLFCVNIARGIERARADEQAELQAVLAAKPEASND